MSNAPVKMIDVAKINPAPYNPRKDLTPDDAEYQRIAASIEAFGLVEPLVWNERSGNLVGGHQRFKVLVARGEKRVPCAVVDLDDDRERALNVALNKIDGAWDRQALFDLLKPMPAELLALTGFNAMDVSKLVPAPLSAAQQLDGMTFRVVVDCADESAQLALIEQMQREGYTCRALIS